jgi:hypothetical protein
MFKRNLLVLLALTIVPPASAHQHSTAARHSSGCPVERARAAAAAAQAEKANAQVAERKAPTTITLTERVPPESSLWAMGQGSGLLNP